MVSYRAIKFKLYKWRAAWRKRRRLWFPSPAEVELIRIMGGKYITFGWIKDPLPPHFPMTLILDLGTIFKRELIEREVRAGAMYIDFGVQTPYYAKGIEVDGLLWHQDIVHEQDRDDYLAQYGWQVLHILASEIYNNPNRVQQRIMNFLRN